MTLVAIAEELRDAVRPLRFSPPVSHVYSPLDYAWPAHRAYLERFGSPPNEIVLVGMNPGPWGMAQTGVPFGEVAAVRDWLGISAPVGRPEREHPARPVTGFACTRSEVSGRRVWGWARELSGTPGRFLVSELYDSPRVLPETFDVVYTGVGALNWLPDIRRWAEVVAGFLAPGGLFYIREAHPVIWSLDWRDDGVWMTGPTAHVFDGVLHLDRGAS